MHLLNTAVEQNWTVKCKTRETIYYSYKNTVSHVGSQPRAGEARMAL